MLDGLKIRDQAWVDGQFLDALSGDTFASVNPADGRVITQVAHCDKEDVDQAVTVARDRFESGIWRLLAPAERKARLLKWAELIALHQLEFAVLETIDMGKPIAQSFYDDIPECIARISWYAEALDKIYDQVAPTEDNVVALISHEPIGVVAAITPWNFPLCEAVSKIAPALAMGNSVILKPAEQSPLSAIRAAELALEAGIPKGVFNVLPGFGETAGQAIALHPDVDIVSFTGSTDVGQRIMQMSGQSNMKRVLLECGGKSPNIVFADYKDIQKAATAAANSVFYNQGEVCCATTRLLVENQIKDDFLALLKDEATRYQPGDPLEPACPMGAIVDETQLKKIKTYIARGQKEGARLVLGGKQVLKETGGFFIEPTIFDNVQTDMQIAQNEIFGPVLSVLGFDEEREAIQKANDTRYGLAASVWTNDLERAHRVSKAIRAGTVSINSITSGNTATPFGGYKQSGIGREKGINGLYNYTETKTTWIELASLRSESD